jgi:hypothetical protein
MRTVYRTWPCWSRLRSPPGGRFCAGSLARYVREHQPWALYHEPHSLQESVPRWLRRRIGFSAFWRCQGLSFDAVSSPIWPHTDWTGYVRHQSSAESGPRWAENELPGILGTRLAVPPRSQLLWLPISCAHVTRSTARSCRIGLRISARTPAEPSMKNGTGSGKYDKKSSRS